MNTNAGEKVVYLQKRIAEKAVGSKILKCIKYGSRELVHCLNRALDVAPTNLTVLIEGETGTGKEFIAKLIHEQSDRKECELVVVDCATIDRSLINSFLFGHTRGAFSGADANKEGLFQVAHKSTIFLDEIGELPLEVQTNLLRILQNGTFIKLGETKARKVDVRVIAATNKRLSLEVESGKFREDLFYRLNDFNIWLPPLRERPGDITVLANYFKESAISKGNPRIVRFSDDTVTFMENYPWPGNVRQLKSSIERALIICPDGEIRPEHLELELAKPSIPENGLVIKLDSWNKMLGAFKRTVLLVALKTTSGNRLKAANLLGIQRSHISRLIGDYEITNGEIEKFSLGRFTKPGFVFELPEKFSQIEKLENDIKRLRETKVQNARIDQQLEKELEEINRENSELEKALKKASAEAEKSSLALGQAQEKIKALEKELKSQEQRKNAADVENLLAVQEKLKEKEKEADGLREEVSQIKNKLDETNKELEGLKSSPEQQEEIDLPARIMRLQGASEFLAKFPGITPGITTLKAAELYARIAQFAVHLNKTDGNISAAARLMGAHPASLSIRKANLLKKGFNIQQLRKDSIYSNCKIPIGTSVETSCLEARKGLLSLLYRFTLGNAKETAALAGIKESSYFNLLSSYGIGNDVITPQDRKLHQTKRLPPDNKQTLESENELLAKRISSLEKELEQEALRKEIDPASRLEIAKLNQQLEEQKKRIAELSREHASKTETMQYELLETKNLLGTEISEKKKEISLLVGLHQEELRKLQNKLAEKAAGGNAVWHQQSERQGENGLAGQNSGLVADLERKNRELQAQIGLLKREKASLEDEILLQMEDLEDRERQLENGRSFAAELGNELSSLREASAKERETSAARLIELGKQLAIINKLQRAISQKDLEIKKLREIITSTKSRLKELENSQKKGFNFFKGK